MKSFKVISVAHRRRIFMLQNFPHKNQKSSFRFCKYQKENDAEKETNVIETVKIIQDIATLFSLSMILVPALDERI